MTTMRHRKHNDSVAARGSSAGIHPPPPSHFTVERNDSDDLSRPLVSGDGDEDGFDNQRRHRSGSHIAGSPPPSPAVIIAPRWAASISVAADSASSWFLDKLPNTWTSALVPAISPQHRGRLRDFEARHVVAYDKSNPAHSSMLFALWEECHRCMLGRRGLESTVEMLAADGDLVSNHWKQFGFQGTDPATDFRGAGAFALQNLLYLAAQHSDAFGRWLECEIPFAIASINVTMSLMNLLDMTLGRTTCLATSQPNRCYTAQLARYHFSMWMANGALDAESHAEYAPGSPRSPSVGGGSAPTRRMEHVFGEVHFLACSVLYDEWYRSPAPRNIMLFNQFLKAAVTRLEGQLRAASTGGVDRLTEIVEESLLSRS